MTDEESKHSTPRTPESSMTEVSDEDDYTNQVLHAPLNEERSTSSGTESSSSSEEPEEQLDAGSISFLEAFL